MSASLSSKLPRRELLMALILLLALCVTRSGITRSHFGTAINLPDASWAVFWMMGAFTSRKLWPAMLLTACLAIDYWVIAHGVNDYCFTPAYPFLIPAYLSLWAAGRWSRTQLPLNLRGMPRLMVSVLIGVSACFLISNVGFYLSSGYFANLSVSTYAQAVARYWPAYLVHTTIYVAVGLALYYIIKHRRIGSAANHTRRN